MSRVRLGEERRTHVGMPVRLWIVRGWTTSSDICLTLQVAASPPLASACDGVGTVTGRHGFVLGPTAERGHRRWELIGGLTARTTASVRVQLTDGTTMLVRTHAGAWVAELRPDVQGARRVRSVTAVGAA